MRNSLYLFLLCVFFLQPLAAQDKEAIVDEVNEDDLGNVTDEFQEHFFEALKQKGIENYEKAIISLEACLELEPENAVVYFEMGRNYRELENYELALENYQKALDLEPKKEDILVEIYHTNRSTGDFDQAIETVKKLMDFNPDYKEDLANLYMLNEDHEQALQVLDELDEEEGISGYRNTMRRQIYARTGNTDAQIGNLEEGIEQDPENEQNYLNLIYIYSEQGDEEEAYQTALELLETNPGSSLAHLALYKFYLDRNKPEAAVNSMKIVFESEEIDPDSKFKVLNDFLLFVDENPNFEDELLEVSQSLVEWEDAPKLYEQLGKFYLNKAKNEEALKFFEKGIAQDPDNFELTKNTLLLQIEAGRNEEAKKLSSEALEVFPAQPFLYLLQGVALNNLEEYGEAEEILTFGLDYLIDNTRLEIDFYNQLSAAYSGLEDEEKAAEFKEKADELLKELE
ncbi:tetratricopeptide repeat protein [Salegentibacter sp.]|uniref:tetratricopeptide repeat protein n=1 Tax=Salegentibacter sp. TaxID=1903072 RepID=UPI0035670BD1